MSYDFSGWATKYNIRCADGRTIMPGAFKDGLSDTVPVVWNHQHNDVKNVLGQAKLEHKDGEGVYAYVSLNETEGGKYAKELVKHGDIKAMSIMATNLLENGPNVAHGCIREVSLVLAGANPAAFIENVMVHSLDGSGYEPDDEIAVIFSGFTSDIILQHADEGEKTESKTDGKTVQAVVDSMDDEQQTLFYSVVGDLVEEIKELKGSKDSEGGKDEMKHNAFENNNVQSGGVLTQSLTFTPEMQATVINDAKRWGSMKESALQHGITNIEYMFPDAATIDKAPGWVSRPMEWVSTVLNGTRHTPFSRIKSLFADITEEDARAKGYIKGKLKKEEVFSLLKRVTTPQTIYKKQRIDRDDVIDIVDFDVISWLKTEMRMMLNEELARAALIGDGRDGSSDDKINPLNIRPIATDDDFYTIKATIENTSSMSEEELAKAFITTAIKSRTKYRGSGNPILFTTEEILTSMMLIQDTTGRDIYETEDKLRSKLRVSKIVTVPVMEGAKGKNEGDLMGIIVNLSDYTFGADKGGAVSLFDDFDIDYNAYKYLIETRCSGALIRPYSAIAIEATNA